MDLGTLADNTVVSGATVDVVRQREATRRRRLTKVFWCFGLIGGYLWYRILVGSPMRFGLPHLTQNEINNLPIFLLVGMLVPIIVLPMLLAGRSPHVRAMEKTRPAALAAPSRYREGSDLARRVRALPTTPARGSGPAKARP